jgi:HAD superfamily hydrolase (TIGR01509 family)
MFLEVNFLMSFDLIIFDCDGVLVDSEPLANDLLRNAFEEEGLYLTLEDVIQHFVGLSMPSVVAKAEEMTQTTFQADFLDKLQIKTFSAFEKSLKAVSGIKVLIEELLAHNIKICVASSGGYEKMDITLGITGLKEYFGENIFSASEVKRGKPYPDLFLYAAEQMGVEPACALVIEDSLYGVQAAVFAGIEVMAYSVRGEDRALKMAGGLLVHHINDVSNHIFGD